MDFVEREDPRRSHFGVYIGQLVTSISVRIPCVAGSPLVQNELKEEYT